VLSASASHFDPLPTEIARRCNMSRWVKRRHAGLKKNSLTVCWFTRGNAATEVCDEVSRLVLQAFGHKILRSFENLDCHKT
jgi:hypothetical protein